MFARRLYIEYTGATGVPVPCPLAWIDNFAMRNFTNDAAFDDTLPLADGLMEAGNYVPLLVLTEKMEAWFRRKQYLGPDEHLRIREL